MATTGSTNLRGILLVLPSMLWLLVFAIIPVAFLICLSLWSASIFGIEQTWDFRNYITISSDSVYLLIMLRTLRISIAATLLSLLLSYPLAMFLVSLKGRSRTLFLLLMFLPFWSSYVVRSFMWLPVLGRAHVGYLPTDRVVGISKLARVVHGFARRLQIQEKLTAEIAHAIHDILKPKGVGVVIEAEHSCMTLRGVNTVGSHMITSHLTGAIRDDARTRQEFLRLTRRG